MRLLPLLLLPCLLVAAALTCAQPKQRVARIAPGCCPSRPPSRAEVVSVVPRHGTGQRENALHCVVAGTVWDAENADTLVPMRSAVVRLMDTERIAVTDSSGRYRLGSIPAWLLTLQASYMGYQCVNVRLKLNPGDSATVNFKMRYMCLSP